MANVNISDLPLTAAVNLTDTLEKLLTNTTPNERVTIGQIVTFLQTALASLSVAGGKFTVDASGKVICNDGSGVVQLSTDGTASQFDTGLTIGIGPTITLDAAGTASIAGGRVAIASNGSITLDDGGSKIKLLTTGSPVVMEPGLAIGPEAGPTISLNVDGSASFGVGAAQIFSDGSASFASGGTTLGVDGSASFAAANATIASDGVINTVANYSVFSTQVVGVQQAAIADATGAGDVVARLNDLLAACRAHGLIAT